MTRLSGSFGDSLRTYGLRGLCYRYRFRAHRLCGFRYCFKICCCSNSDSESLSDAPNECCRDKGKRNCAQAPWQSGPRRRREQ